MDIKPYSSAGVTCWWARSRVHAVFSLNDRKACTLVSKMKKAEDGARAARWRHGPTCLCHGSALRCRSSSSVLVCRDDSCLLNAVTLVFRVFSRFLFSLSVREMGEWPAPTSLHLHLRLFLRLLRLRPGSVSPVSRRSSAHDAGPVARPGCAVFGPDGAEQLLDR